jgi:hypothetical protein
MAEMRYNLPQLLSLLGEEAMNMEKIFDQSPFIQRIKAEAEKNRSRHDILHVLEKQLGSVPEDLAAHLRAIEDQQKLDSLLDVALECADLEAFRAAITNSE